MAEYAFRELEQKWQKYWSDNQLYKVSSDSEKPKFYALDMFPYPSGAGLHVGHPLGYIASDIVSRFKRMKGFNVLHPMGFDSFGLPAEQYAIQTGQHPAITTANNIARYKEQLKNIGFSYDWSRQVATSEAQYYRWTQWIFGQLFNSYYSISENKAMPISALEAHFSELGTQKLNAVCEEGSAAFTAGEWQAMSEEKKAEQLLNYRLAFLSDALVNWCPKLGTVLANDEVKDGLSERGGYPVVRKKMRQWSLRISAYADRLLEGLDTIDWPDALKEMQRNWIGKSIGAEVYFPLSGHSNKINIFTTRIDTIFGSTYMVLAPEHELVQQITTEEQQTEVSAYVDLAKNRSERDRMTDVKTVSGVFTGAYAINPFTNKQIPVWIGDYVLAGYGTGAIMAVPAHDSRDWAFARHFNLPIIPVVEGGVLDKEAYDAKDGQLINSGFLTGLSVAEAQTKAIAWLEENGLGNKKINYRMRDAIFSRQRYWGEPIPIYYENGTPKLLPDDKLPLRLPEVNAYLPTETGEPPLARAKNWHTEEGHPFETNTMPGWAGSSWYLFRYMDPENQGEFVGKNAQAYWQNVDLYIGGSEHATGHLLYSRFWTKFLYDIGKLSVEEPFKKLINQGMIQGRSNFVYRLNDKPNTFVSYSLKDNYDTSAIHVDVSLTDNDVLDLEGFKAWRPDFVNADFILETEGTYAGKYVCGAEVEKMSKSKYNVVSPDEVIEGYGADTLRLYEMFLGPIEQSKPWNTNGIDGVHKFLKKMWRLFYNNSAEPVVQNETPTAAEQKVINTLIKKATEDIDRYSFNTSVAAFMICVNELNSLKCNKKEILEKLVLVVAPYAPHIAEELWHVLGHTESVLCASYPLVEEKYLLEDSFEYPVSINGKVRTKLTFGNNVTKEVIQSQVLANEIVLKWTEGRVPKKVIIVPNRIVNLVV